MTATLLLVRHAHTEIAGRFCGVSDPPLSAVGIEQLPQVNDKLVSYPLTHIFASPLQRARQTAEFIARRRNLHVSYLEVLRELAFGSWEGLDWEQVMARDPEYAQRWLANYPQVPAPRGEHFEDFRQRVQYAMRIIAGEAAGGCAVVVTHAGVIRTFLGGLTQQQTAVCNVTSCDYASVSEVRHGDGEWRLTESVSEDSADAASLTVGPSEVLR